VRVLEETLPEAFLLENVPGLAFSGKSDGLRFVEEQVRAINLRAGTSYQLSVACLNAAEFGVPQVRQRVFIIGHREGRPFKFPEPSHGDEKQGLGALKPYKRAWDALGDLPEINGDPALNLSGKWAELLQSIPEGQNYLWHTDRGGGLPLFGWRRRYWNFLLKLARGLPSWTIQAQPGPATGPFHWTNRKLSVRELLRLQTFPDNVELTCNRQDAQRLVGNAVPSALAEVLARSMGAQFFGAKVSGDALLIPSCREQMPPPWPVGEVPLAYRSLIAEHTAHPGTGRGNRAVQFKLGAPQLV
jgi:DNA (cytosine-5)-methyltransferase 1